MSILERIIDLPIPFNMVVLVTILITGSAVITSIAKETRKFYCHREEADLKRDLAARGMSADEIQQVISSKLR